ncbi:MAG TPA: hypothetical protein PKV13_08985 [Propionicimonas sp.]|nr:hypothetical protein [Propionicimonas sp.]HRA06739.1 hypothetical protein [Propionicimonas sp.]
MSDQQPTQFENYPPRPEPSGGDDGLTSPRPVPPLVIPATPIADERRGVPVFGRRTAIGVGTGVAALLGLAVLNARSSSVPEPQAWASSAVAYPDDYEDPDGYVDPDDEQAEVPTLDVVLGDYSANLPAGWKVASRTENTVVITSGTNRLLARAAVVSGAAVDVIAKSVKSRLGSFKGEFDEPEDVSFGDTDAAILTGSGKIGKAAARLVAQLWIDLDANSLLVVQTLTAKPDSARALEAQDIADQLSGTFT